VQALEETDFWELLSSVISDWGCLPLYPTKVPPELLEDVDLQMRIHLWFIHDGTPLHFLLTFWEFLNHVLLEQWTGQGGPRVWRACSPDLNPLDFYFWAYLKCTVYAQTSLTANTE
jgi:hypothetical protein